MNNSIFVKKAELLLNIVPRDGYYGEIAALFSLLMPVFGDFLGEFGAIYSAGLPIGMFLFRNQ